MFLASSTLPLCNIAAFYCPLTASMFNPITNLLLLWPLKLFPLASTMNSISSVQLRSHTSRPPNPPEPPPDPNSDNNPKTPEIGLAQAMQTLQSRLVLR